MPAPALLALQRRPGRFQPRIQRCRKDSAVCVMRRRRWEIASLIPAANSPKYANMQRICAENCIFMPHNP